MQVEAAGWREHADGIEADRAQLKLLRTTLISKLELKDEQLAEMQAATLGCNSN